MLASLTHAKPAATLATIALVLTALATASATERPAFTFNGTNGANPNALIMDAAGNIYGVTGTGGGNTKCAGSSCGVVFKLTQTSSVWQETVLHHFYAGFDGFHPNSLILDASGNLYGTTSEGGGKGTGVCQGGCGVIFKLTPTASGPWTETILYRCSGPDCAQPNALAFDAAGNLYGTAGNGGGGSSFCADATTRAGCGVIFQLSATASGPWALTPLHTFLDTADDGKGPIGLTFGAGGVIYGVTGAGGPGGGTGSVYKLTPSSSGWSISFLHSFGVAQDGLFPDTPLMMDTAGNLFGTTTAGGVHRSGMAWELSPGTGGTWNETVLHDFGTAGDGIQPQSGLTLDAAGNLYGTTYLGGGTASQCISAGCGTIFKLTPSGFGTWTESVVFRFTQASGTGPRTTLVPDNAGNFYGTVIFGGAANAGRVFKYTP